MRAMNTDQISLYIDPVKVAARLSAAHHEQDMELAVKLNELPRLREIMWALSWCSDTANYTGGLPRFVRDLVEDSLDLLGTVTMIKCGAREYSEQEKSAVVAELGHGFAERLGVNRCSLFELGGPADDRGGMSSREAQEAVVRAREHQRAEERRKKEKQGALAALRRATLMDACREVAIENLPNVLAQFCQEGGRRDEYWRKRVIEDVFALGYFPRVIEALERFFDRMRERSKAQIAETAVTREVFKWLEKSAATKMPVQIEGNSRFGKSEAVATWCRMQPGRARLIKTPSAVAEGDLLRAVASALGIVITKRSRSPELRQSIEFVLRYSGLQLVFDESQFLLPQNVTRNTEPVRLNWVRTAVIDQGIAAAFVATPQSYRHAERRLVRATGYAIEQWQERMLKTVILPEEIEKEDLRAIARIHFAGIADRYIDYVVNAASATERNYVSDVSKIAALARLSAADAGREKILFADIEGAISDVLPAAPPQAPRSARAKEEASEASAECLERPLHGACKPSARTVQPALRGADETLSNVASTRRAGADLGSLLPAQ